MDDTITRPQNAALVAVDIENIIGLGDGGVAPPADHLSEMCSPQSLAESRERTAQFLTANGLEEHGLVQKDIRGAMKKGWRSRDQYSRGTCTAFAAVAAAELLVAGKTGSKARLSPEFIYWNMRYNPQYMLDRDVDLRGTKLKQALGVLVDMGVPEEAAYPYPRHDPQRGEGPSKTVQAQAMFNRFLQSQYWDIVDHGCPDVPKGLTIYKELAEGRPVCVGVPMYKFETNFKDNWKNRASVDTGIIYGPDHAGNEDKSYKQSSAHVVTIVGFHPDDDENVGGWFIFKNSWGTQFGKYPRLPGDRSPSPFGIGYGAISAHYLEAHCWELLSLKLA